MKSIRVRPHADSEINALADYIAHDNLNAALRFLDAVQKTFNLIAEQPNIGSQRYAHFPMMDGLRMKAISNFENHFIFYIERPSYIDILRVLHSARDIPEAIKEGLDPPL